MALEIKKNNIDDITKGPIFLTPLNVTKAN